MDARKLIDPTQWPQRKLPKLFQRLRHPYRLVFIDDSNLTEVASFRLTKRSVWAVVSMIAILTIGLTVAVLVFSPLKYYIPGYGSGKLRGRVLQLQQASDSLADVLTAQDEQLQRIQAAITGKDALTPDTTPLAPRAIEQAQQEGPLPTAQAVQAVAVPTRPQNTRRSRRR